MTWLGEKDKAARRMLGREERIIRGVDKGPGTRKSREQDTLQEKKGRGVAKPEEKKRNFTIY